MTDLERWHEIKPIVQGALDRPQEERARYLAEACGEDEELRHKVEALLAVSETDARAIDRLQMLPPGMRRPDLAEGDMAGPYRIIRPLGEGGMGIVYLAQDTRIDRRVALKVGARRLSQEQEFLARLRHDNIATFYDCGTTQDGFGYFAMEYVDGEPINRYCDRKGLSVRERLLLFLQVCEAVAFAHRKSVVHRDIKASNILVPDDGKPRLLDFGIAKQLAPDASSLTLTRPEDRAITIAFASPEQLAGEHTDTTTDIYSLGVLLCLLLTGRLPYTVKSYHDLPWAIRNLEPEKPSRLVQAPPLSSGRVGVSSTPSTGNDSSFRKLGRMLAGDLDAIVLRALRKEPEKRYKTVEEFAADIRKNLNDEPVLARRGSTRYKAWKFFKRHTLGVSSSALFVLTVLGLSIWLLVLYREEQHQRNQARIQQERSDAIREFMIRSFELSNPFTLNPSDLTVRDLLSKAASEADATLARQPEQQVAVLALLGQIYNDLGLQDDARRLAQLAVDRGRSRLSATSPALADAYFALGSVETSASHYVQAEELFRRSLSIRLQALGIGHADYSVSMYSLGTALYYQGKVKEAEQLYRETLAIQKKYNPRKTIAIVKSMSALALLLERSQRYEEAEHLYREALAMARRDFGPNHPTVANILDPLAQLLTNTTRFREAEAMHREALAITERSVGQDHPNIILRIYNLGFLLSFQGKDAEAEQMYRQALAASRRIHGEDHAYSLVIGGNLARLLSKRKKHDESLRLVSDVQARAQSILGESHSITVNLTRHKAYVFFDSGNVNAAEREIRRVIDLLNQNPTADPLEIAVSKSLLGDCLIARGEFEEAEPLAFEWYKIAPPRETANALKTLVDLYSRWGKPEKAAEFRKLLAGANSKPSP